MAEINEIISKEAIQGVKDFNTQLLKADKSLTSVILSTKDWDKILRTTGQAKSIEDVKKATEGLTTNTKKLTEAEIAAIKAKKEMESAQKALDKQRQAGLAIMAKEEAKQRELNSAEAIALRQKKQLESDIKRLTKVGQEWATEINKEIAAQNKSKKAHEEYQKALTLEVKTINDAIAQNRALSKARNNLDLSTRDGQKKLESLNATMTKNTEFIRANGTAMEKQRMNIGNYKSALAGIGAQIMASFSVAAIISFGRAAYKAFEEQEVQNRKLLFALNNNKTAYSELTKQASKLQETLGIPDEVINGIQIMAAESGKSTVEIKKITQAATELSILTGQDLQTAYMQLNGTLSGSAGRLGRVDADFTKLTKSQLENGAAIDLVLNKYGGLAEKAVTPTKKLAAAWGEFMETLGSGGTVFDGVFSALTNFINLMGESLKSVKRIKQEVAAENAAGDVTSGLSEIDAIKKKLMSGGMSEKTADTKAYSAYIATQNNTIAASQSRVNELKKQYMQLSGKDAAAKWSQIKAEQAYAKSIQDEVDGIKKARAENNGYNKEVDPAIHTKITEYQKLTDRIADLNSAITDLKLANQPVPNSMIHELISSQAQLENVKKEVEAIAAGMVAIQSKGYQAGNIPTSGSGGIGLLTRRNTVNTGGDIGRTPLMSEQDKKQLAIDSAQITADASFNIIQNSMAAEYDLKMSYMEREKEAKLNNANLTEKQKAKITADYEKKAAKLKSEQFKKEKAAAVVQSIINTALAVTAAMAAIPFSLSRAILAGMTGAAQTAVIAAQPIPKFDKGTTNSPDTFIAGEKRPEFLITPSGSVQHVTKPTLFKGMAGSTVISGEDTERIMKVAGRDGINGFNLAPNFDRLENSIVSAVKSQTHFHFNASGNRIFKQQGNYKEELFNKKVSWQRNQN